MNQNLKLNLLENENANVKQTKKENFDLKIETLTSELNSNRDKIFSLMQQLEVLNIELEKPKKNIIEEVLKSEEILKKNKELENLTLLSNQEIKKLTIYLEILKNKELEEINRETEYKQITKILEKSNSDLNNHIEKLCKEQTLSNEEIKKLKNILDDTNESLISKHNDNNRILEEINNLLKRIIERDTTISQLQKHNKELEQINLQKNKKMLKLTSKNQQIAQHILKIYYINIYKVL